MKGLCTQEQWFICLCSIFLSFPYENAKESTVNFSNETEARDVQDTLDSQDAKLQAIDSTETGSRI